MRLAAVLVVLAGAVVLLLAAGCGGGDDDTALEQRREAVDAYIRKVNQSQATFADAYAQADTTLRRFADGERVGPRDVAALEHAVERMADARAAIERARPPQDAEKLRRDLLRLLELQIELAADLARLTEYLPVVQAPLRGAETARQRLQRGIASAETVAEQAAAADAYGRALATPLRQLGAIEPPEVLRTWHAGQQRQLRESRRLAAELGEALRGTDPAVVEAALADFEQLARDAYEVAKGQAAAVRAFNARVERQRKLVTAVLTEQRRLDRELQ
ncbi:MAG TPA: hypothetical protein VNT23_09630 [Gaiellaceae bacterium]|nr:hypothetical protein [Gaiellaceae bacterium]